jgi:hypothetical protein
MNRRWLGREPHVNRERRLGLVVAALLAIGAVGCGSEGPGFRERLTEEGAVSLAPRRMTVLAETCSLDAFQLSALEQPALRRLARELVIVCPAVRLSGEVAPVDPDARGAVARAVGRARALGYKTTIAATMGDDLASFPVPYSPVRSLPVLRDLEWRDKVVSGLVEFANMADGLEIDFLSLPDDSRSAVTELFLALEKQIRPRLTLGVMAPPSTIEPSDTPGGNAFDLATLAPHVDRVRMMTLDFSCCGQGGGPSIDSGWAVDAARYGKGRAGSVPVDIAFPLYGTDFSDLGERFVDYTDGRAIADVLGIAPERAIGGELHFGWADAAGRAHHTWYPDAVTASRVLGAWNESVLPGDVGVLFYGLGAEDPALFSTVARGLR